MANRVRPEQPARETSSAEQWRRDRADARRLNPERYRRPKKPPAPMTAEELISHRDPSPPPEEGLSE